MKYTVRIKNSMYGYERNQVVQIEAETEQQAISAAQTIDCFADVTIEKEKA